MELILTLSKDTQIYESAPRPTHPPEYLIRFDDGMATSPNYNYLTIYLREEQVRRLARAVRRLLSMLPEGDAKEADRGRRT